MEQPYLEKTANHSWTEQFAEIPFSKISSNEWYAPLSEEDSALRLRAKVDFFEDETLAEPRIDYPKLRNEHAFDATEKQYQKLLDEATTDAEYEKAARRLAELYRINEAMRLKRLSGAMGQAVLKQELSRERAGTMAAEIFGEPDRDSFLSLTARLRTQATELQDEMPEAAELLALLGDATPEVVHNSVELEKTTLSVLHEDLREIFPGIDDVITIDEERGEHTAEATLQYIERYLDFFGLTAKGWKTELIDGSKVAANTNSSTKLITIGELRAAEFDSVQSMKTSIHEVLGHAYRSEGETSQASLKFEEAFAVALEQIMTGESRKGSGEQYYTALGLQYGLDQDGKQRNYRDTFEIMWRRAMVIARTKGEELTEDEAKDQAYTQVYRTRRGNAIDTRDMAYFEGARVVPQWLNGVAALPKEERQNILRWVFSGRFDPTDAEQVGRYPLP